jgi:hypothetical protein
MEEEEIKEDNFNPDALDDALDGDMLLDEDDEELYFTPASADDDLDIAFTDHDSRDWL